MWIPAAHFRRSDAEIQFGAESPPPAGGEISPVFDRIPDRPVSGVGEYGVRSLSPGSSGGTVDGLDGCRRGRDCRCGGRFAALTAFGPCPDLRARRPVSGYCIASVLECRRSVSKTP